MPQSQPNEEFERLKADVLKGLEQAQRGELIPAEEVWAEVRATIAEVARKRRR